MSEKKSILIIDDDVQLVDSLKDLLDSVGFQVSYAYQSNEGMKLAQEIKPDLILLDVLFAGPPGPDGIEVSRQLHQNPVVKDIPVIVLSGVKQVLDFPVKLGPDETWMPVKAFLEKPFKPNKLLAEIEKVLGPRPAASLE